MKAFIVFGQTGEYSDHVDWPVRGFVSREKAEAFEFELTKWAKRAKAWTDEHDCAECYGLKANGRKCAFPEPGADPGFRLDYTGTDYYTIEVEVEGT